MHGHNVLIYRGKDAENDKALKAELEKGLPQIGEIVILRKFLIQDVC
jgi:hypothetical protein